MAFRVTSTTLMTYSRCGDTIYVHGHWILLCICHGNVNLVNSSLYLEGREGACVDVKKNPRRTNVGMDKRTKGEITHNSREARVKPKPKRCDVLCHLKFEIMRMKQRQTPTRYYVAKREDRTPSCGMLLSFIPSFLSFIHENIREK